MSLDIIIRTQAFKWLWHIGQFPYRITWIRSKCGLWL